MKKRFFAFFTVLCAIIVLSSFVTPAIANSGKSAKEDEILKTRFSNMLNHNYLYDEDFDDMNVIVNNSVLSVVVPMTEKPEFVKEDVVLKVLGDMYGITSVDFSSINVGCPQKHGYVYVMPRGYSTYKHKVISAVRCEDGTYLVNSEITVKNHDGGNRILKSLTRFTENKNSSFGYNIVYSEILNSQV